MSPVPLQIQRSEINIPLYILKNKELTILESIIKYLKEKNLTYKGIADLLNRDQRNIWTIYSRIKNKGLSSEIRIENKIPITIFSKKLGGLEAITKYMKENLGMSYHEIAELLDRDDRTIWTSYNKAVKKQKQPIIIKRTNILLPINIFKKKKLTILEAIIINQKKKGLRYNEIAELLDRDQRNVYTIYSNAVKKIQEKSLKRKFFLLWDDKKGVNDNIMYYSINFID